MSKQIGDDIRALRKVRGLTIKQLAERIGRSSGWLSEIERGQTIASVRDLSLIATVLEVNVSFFFRSSMRKEEEQGIVLRRADRVSIGSSESGLVEELLSPTLSGSFEVISSVFAPHSDGGRIITRTTEDAGVIISGQLTLTVEGSEFVLEQGDCFQFAQKSYSWKNTGDVPAVVIWVISPPIY